MRLGNLSGRAVLVTPDNGAVLDLAEASGGRLPAAPNELFARFDEVRAVAAEIGFDGARPYDRAQLGPPSPSPSQVFAIGLNYRDHVSETNSALPSEPMVFTKFPSCVAGPDVTVPHPGGSLDWEVELVVVVGRRGRRIPAGDAWDHIAGLTVGQDLSERELQHKGRPPQFSLAKSYEHFGPIGPVLVTSDEFADPDDLEIGCRVNGESVQKARTSDMVFAVPELVERLSAIVELLPGDLIFTGTPAGVGLGQDPPRFLAVGDELTSHIQGIGELYNSVVAGWR